MTNLNTPDIDSSFLHPHNFRTHILSPSDAVDSDSASTTPPSRPPKTQFAHQIYSGNLHFGG